MTAPVTAATPGRRRLEGRAVEDVGRLRHDIERFCRRCIKIRDKHGDIRPLVFNAVQQRIVAAEREALRTTGQFRGVVLKGRQGGVTTLEQAANLHQIWSERNFDTLTMAHTKDDTEKIFLITTRAIAHFPPKLLPEMGIAQRTEVSFTRRDALFYTGTAGSKRTGRGLTLKRFHGSEFFLWDDPVGSLATVGPALVPRRSVITLESTASGYDSPGHNFWRRAREGGNGYTALFFPWWLCDVENYRLPLLEPDELGALEEDEELLIEHHGLDLEQIKWRRAKIAEYERPRFLQEFAEDEESCWLDARSMFYDAALLKVLHDRTPVPLSTDRNGALEVYAELRPGERAIIGCDTAEGGGDDRQAWTARAFSNGGYRLLATFADATVEPKELAGLLNTWGRKLASPALGPALLVIEKNAHGITVLRHLRDDHKYPFERLYHRQIADKNQTERTDRLGWLTSEESKPILLDAGRELFTAARDGYAEVPSLATIRDAFAVRRDVSGRVKLNGRDMLVSEMLAWVGRSYPVRPISHGFVPASEAYFSLR